MQDAAQTLAKRIEWRDPALRTACARIARRVEAAGGRAYAVGGGVRDALRGQALADLDLEVLGLDAAGLRAALGADFALHAVGRSFAVFKLAKLPIDLALAERPDATLVEAAARRDFTINALYFDPLREELHDPCGGLADLAAGRLRHASERFGEDPLRVLRAMQFAARFDFDVAEETVALCSKLSSAGLARERVFGEWRKLLCAGRSPSRGLAFLRACGWLRDTPELEALIGVPQDPEWHPEGDVWVHTLHALDAFAGERVGDAQEDLIVGLAVLCHDLGKPATTRLEKGRITSKRHEPLGVELTRQLLERWTEERALLDAVPPLVAAHLAPNQLHRAQAGDAAIRRLARRVGRIDRLVRVARADQQGRPPRVFDGFPAGEWLLARARALGVDRAPPEPLVQGRDLVALGLAPGPAFEPLLAACYDAQIEGRFGDVAGGIAFLRRTGRLPRAR